MPEAEKKKHSKWLDLITPETVLKLMVLLFGFTLSTGYFLNEASNVVSANATTNARQDDSLGGLETAVMGLLINNATVNATLENTENELIEIKQMIRNLE